MKTFILSAMLLSLSACGLELSHKDEKKDESYSYDYEENGCKTGKHGFDSKSAYCSALQNEGLNNGCASSLRQKSYDADCR